MRRSAHRIWACEALCACVLCSQLARAEEVTDPPIALDQSVVEPPKAVERVDAEYPPRALAEGRSGRVELFVTVGAEGSVLDVEVAHSGGADFDEAATRAASKWRFTPALQNGEPVVVRIRIPFEFVPPPAEEPAPDSAEATLPENAPGSGLPDAAEPADLSTPSAFPPVIDVEVRGPHRMAPREDEAAAASVITRDRTPRSTETLPQLLAEQPGVAITQLGGIGSMSLVSLRGSTWEQVHVYVDGVPLNASVGGGVDLSTIPLGDVERIEIYRGTSPVGFGASAIGGIVSVTTRDPSRSGVSAEVGAGSFGTRSAGVHGAIADDRFKVFVGAHVLHSDGDFTYLSNDGTAFGANAPRRVVRENNALDQLDGTLRMTWPLRGERKITLSTSIFQRDQGLAGFGIYPTEAASLSTFRALSSAHYSSTSDLGSDSELRGVVFLSRVHTQFRDLLSEIALSPVDTSDRTTLLGTTWTPRKTWDWFTLSGALSLRREVFRPADSARNPPLGPPATRLFAAPGLEAIFDVRPTRLEVTPSVRVEWAQDTVTGRTIFQRFVPPSPPQNRVEPLARLSAVQRPTDWLALKANGGRYARFPNFTELYGNSGFVLGNPNLSPESGWNGDVGAEVTLTSSHVRLTADLFGFGSLPRELIQYQQGSYGTQRASNVASAQILGLEASLRAELGPYVHTLAQATWLDARDTTPRAASEQRQLPLRPRWRSYLRPELRRLPLPSGFTWGVYTDFDVTGGNYLDPANLVRMPQRLLWGAGGHVSTPKERWKLVVSALNLTNSTVHDIAGFPLPGRSLFATLHGSLEAEETKPSNSQSSAREPPRSPAANLHAAAPGPQAPYAFSAVTYPHLP